MHASLGLMFERKAKLSCNGQKEIPVEKSNCVAKFILINFSFTRKAS